MWVIKINNDELTDKDKEMISLIDNSTSDFISLLYKKDIMNLKSVSIPLHIQIVQKLDILKNMNNRRKYE